MSAIWFLQASNDPNTRESQKIAAGMIGTLENFFVEEARVIDDDLFKFFTTTINSSKYRALFEETQPIYTAGRKEVNKRFPPGTKMVDEIFDHYANVMLSTTKQDKNNMLSYLHAIDFYLDKMCGLANQAEREGF